MNNRYNEVIKKLKNKELIILDGATGSELENRGIEMDNTWCGSASLQKDVLKQIHKDYIAAGAQIITTNTYASSRMILESGGVDDQFEEINLSAINCAIEARNEIERDDDTATNIAAAFVFIAREQVNSFGIMYDRIYY